MKLYNCNEYNKDRTALKSFYLFTCPVILMLVSGCNTMKPTQQAFEPIDYTRRHPISLKSSVEHMDVYATNGRIDQRQYLDVISFGKDYAENGSGVISAAIPNNSGGQVPLQAITSLQQALAEGGVTQQLELTRYDANPKVGASPIRLSFVKMKAKVESECGQWPSDLAGGKDLESWHNRPYHNLGCSQQTIFASQVANPNDLVRPRGEGPIDVTQRVKSIQALRLGGGNK